MRRLLQLCVCLLTLGLCEGALACRPMLDPMNPMKGLNPAVVAVFIGEIVGVRNKDRLQELTRCEPKSRVMETKEERDARANSTVPDTLGCVEGPVDYEVEVYPTEVLLG